ncbi:MAG: GGDEF domain-containing response regulator [Spirochaetaceae bacterium]|nr:MAG: GGDEF domain-containing response regulator [Spirochaetaceae bacterium]
MKTVPVILVADDNKINRLVVKATLKGYDYRVVEAADGQEAVEVALREEPDLILMDMMMPVMDGLKATSILKEHSDTSRTPVLMLTALSETEDRIKAFDAGVTGFLTKPFDRMELLAHIRSYLNLSLVNRKYILSTVSPISGLPNRAAFREESPQLKRPKLFVVQMDHIGTIGRFYGEAAAHSIELRFANFLQTTVRDTIEMASSLYHIHRGIFAVLIDDPFDTLTREAATAAAERMNRTFLGHQIFVDDVQYHSDYTLVVSFAANRPLEEAELALYEAGRRKVDVLFAGDIAEQTYSEIERNMTQLNNIKNAVNEHRFRPLFQPILEIETGKIVKYEALIRMVSPDGTVHSPAEFLHVAKNSRYYQDITRIVFEKSIAAFRDRTEDINVNLSVLDIHNEETRSFLMRLLEDNPEVAKRLTIEIVEEEGAEHYDTVKEFIQDVRAFGVKIAIDDFGSGYSNFQRIMDLNIDFIKIDGSLVKHICDNPVFENLVRVIKSFAAFSGIPVVAEFVESEEMVSVLHEIGIEYAQGYYVGKPAGLDNSKTAAAAATP